MTDDDKVGIPEACDESTDPSPVPPRLLLAFRRYERAYADARPGTLSAVELARARLDLTLLLCVWADRDGDQLSGPVLDQLARDAQTLVQVTAPLPEEHVTS